MKSFRVGPRGVSGRVRAWVFAPLVASTATLLQGCDICAGTPSCTTPPHVSAGGQFIERTSGHGVAGVHVEFVRQSGPELRADTLRGASDGGGFFQLRGDAAHEGTVTGTLRVVPPAPHPPYEMQDVRLRVTTRRADGDFLGRLNVGPYLVLVGHVYDRFTGANLSNATVVMRHVGGVSMGTESVQFVTDENGRFAWIDAPGVALGTVRAEFEITVPGASRSYVVPRNVATQVRDGQISFASIPVGSGVAYWGITSRRGSDERLPGVQVTFRRTGGLTLTPEEYTVTARDDGFFQINFSDDRSGIIIGDLTLTPPPPYAPQVTTGLVLQVRDDDTPIDMGNFGFGAQVYLSAYFRYRATDEPVSGVLGEVRRAGGMETLAPAADAGLRALAADGRLVYAAATTDTGTVLFDIILHLPAPFVAETLRAIPVPARFSDAPVELGTFLVGPGAGAARAPRTP